MSANENRRLWDAVYKTDPKHTKQVNQRGGFTSIDAYYQFERATEQFGPLGTGWGYDATFRFHDDLIVCEARIWYEQDGKRSEPFPVCAMHAWRTYDKSGAARLDDDAGKKVLTDALTKGLSYLGFSADVFMGRYDDNKYVAALKREFADEEAPKAPAPANQSQAPALPAEVRAGLDKLLGQIKESRTDAELATVRSTWRDEVLAWKANHPAAYAEVQEALKNKTQELSFATARAG